MLALQQHVCKHAMAALCQAAGAALSLIDCCVQAAQARLDEGESPSRVPAGFGICRPPGHHAVRQSAMGFCLFSTIAIAARYAQQQHGLRKVGLSLPFLCTAFLHVNVHVDNYIHICVCHELLPLHHRRNCYMLCTAAAAWSQKGVIFPCFFLESFKRLCRGRMFMSQSAVSFCLLSTIGMAAQQVLSLKKVTAYLCGTFDVLTIMQH